MDLSAILAAVKGYGAVPVLFSLVVFLVIFIVKKSDRDADAKVKIYADLLAEANQREQQLKAENTRLHEKFERLLNKFLPFGSNESADNE